MLRPRRASTERDQEEISLGQPANLAPGFPTRAELAARYAETSGRDLSELDSFTALGYWKLRIIVRVSTPATRQVATRGRTPPPASKGSQTCI